MSHTDSASWSEFWRSPRRAVAKGIGRATARCIALKAPRVSRVGPNEGGGLWIPISPDKGPLFFPGLIGTYPDGAVCLERATARLP